MSCLLLSLSIYVSVNNKTVVNAVFDFDEPYLRAQVELGAQIGTVGKPYISTFQRVQYERKRTLEQKVMDAQRGIGVSCRGGGEQPPNFAPL